MRPEARRGLLAWAAIVVPLIVVLVLCCTWSPIVRDGWGHVRWHRFDGLDAPTFWKAVRLNYWNNNPRLGQMVTLLLFTPGGYHVAVIPLLELGLFTLLTAHALGRWPRLRSADDALAFLTVTALVAACSPIVGQILFYRPYVGNYLFGFTMQAAFLLPYRLRGEGGPATAAGWWWRAPAMLLLGGTAGMCNEHTGLAVGFAALVAVIGCSRRGDRPSAPMLAWMLAGLVGLGIGYLALLLAPGQDHRYSSLAQQASTLERITDRGAGGDAWLVVRTLWYLGFAAPWLALGVLARRRAGAAAISRGRRAAIATGLAAAVLAALTLLGSPKEGERLAFASCALAATAVASWVLAQLAPGWSRRVCVALGALALAYIAARCLGTLHTLSGEFDARMAAIAAAPKDSTITVAPYSIGRSRWFLGDDFLMPGTRQYVADTFGIGHIELAPASR